MSSAIITLIGMQSYMKQFDKDLFELLTLPDSIDKETVIDNILLKGSEFEVLYSNPDLLHDAIGVFSKKWQRTFNKWIEALNIDYNPLENYDRIEDWTDTGSNTGTVTNGYNNHNSMTDNNNINTTNEVSAYNTSNFQNDSKNTSSSNGGSTSDGNGTNTETNDLHNNNIHTGRLHGNIGVTTSQQMLQSELDIVKWNVIEHITDMFLQEFCIMVY